MRVMRPVSQSDSDHPQDTRDTHEGNRVWWCVCGVRWFVIHIKVIGCGGVELSVGVFSCV